MDTQEEAFPGLEQTLSSTDSKYLGWAEATACDIPYTLNTQLSESLYTPLHTLEVALRNRIHHVMSGEGEDWYCNMTIRPILSRQTCWPRFVRT